MTHINRKTRRSQYAGAALCTIAAALTLGTLNHGAQAVGAAPAIGAPAPAFTLPDVKTGASTSLASIRQGKKATVVMFIATRCPVSNDYNARMVALAQTFAPRGVAFVGINANQTEPVAECAAHAQAHHFPFAVLKDAQSAVADRYDARVTPETYVINASGVLVYRGRIDNSRDISGVQSHELADALTSVLAGKPVARSEAKAFGCSIKRAGA